METDERPTPTYRGLFRFLAREDLVILLPAVVVSVFSGGLAPAFTILMGRIFTSFGDFSKNQISGAELESQVTVNIIAIVIVGVAAWGLGWAHLALWLAFGENIAKRAREKMMKGLLAKSMTWYDKRVTDAGVSGSMNKAIKYITVKHN
jgi:ATP-binding cassette, subfamily B (MDR/TAP), member 1